MGGPIKNEIGNRYNKLLVVDRADAPEDVKGHRKQLAWWTCKCDCGNICIRSGRQLRESHAEHSRHSCGSCHEPDNIITEHERKVNDLIPIAQEYAFKNAKLPGQWNTMFLDEMDRLTFKANLRVLSGKRLREIFQN